jgi:hypothetical protein
MKWLTAFLLLVLVGCSSPKPQVVEYNPTDRYPNQAMVIDKEVQPLSRNEVIMAINECEANNTRAVMVIAKRRINGFTTDIVADVTCAPKFRY